MTERTIVIAEDLRYVHLRDDYLPNVHSVCAVIVRDPMYSEWPQDGLGFEVIAARQLWDHRESGPPTEAHRQLISIYSSIVNDVRTHFILERHWSSNVTGVEGAFKNSDRIAMLCWNVLTLFDRHRPTRLVCASTPHVEADWVVAHTADQLGIPVYIVGTSPIPWRSWCLEGFRSQTPMELDADESGLPASTPSADVADYVALNRSQTYLAAVPTIDRASQTPGARLRTGLDASGARGGGGPETPTRGARRFSETRRLGHRYLNHKLAERDQRRLFGAYQALAQPLPQDAHIAAVFLHYQPERTTMPEGGVFANQVMAIQALVAFAPPHWQIIVKEHPATFYGPGAFHRGFRHPLMYEAIAGMNSVSLAPLDVTAFELIDASRLVVTITGTVGLQSLCRGVPVLTLGLAAYRKAPGVFSLLDSPDQGGTLTRCFQEVDSGLLNVDQSALLGFLGEVESNSFGERGVSDEAPGSGEFAPTFASRVLALRHVTP